MALGFIRTAVAQLPMNDNWDAGKIKGARQLPYLRYDGFPFLTETWLPGKIEFTDGEVADSLFLRYSSYKDELIYYNKEIGAQINIDKASINGFSFTDTDGRTRTFRKQYFDNYAKSSRYFEVLSSGGTSLLAYRKVTLNSSSPYHDKNGILKNMVFEPNHQFYLYSPEKGYSLVKLSLPGLLAKFDKKLQKPIKKLLRKNRIRIEKESDFVDAWELVEKEGYKVIF